MKTVKKNLSKTELAKIQELVGHISEDDLKYVDAFVTEHLGIFIPSVGFCQYAIRAGHTHPSYSFVIFFSAEQNFLDTTIPLAEDHYLGACLSPELPHEEKETETFTRYIALFINKDYFEQQRRSYTAVAPPPRYFWEPFAVSPETMTDIKRLMAECDHPGHPERSNDATRNALTLLITHGILRSLYPVAGISPTSTKNLDVTAVIDYMEEHFSKKLTVAALARKMGLSQSQFTRRFKQETGLTPMDFFMTLRIKKAQKLLGCQSKTMTEIAQDCGFGSTAHFSAAFKKHTSLSPSAYQLLYQKS